MKVAVYFNLHKDVFSLQSRDKDTYGRVIGHREQVLLKNAKFVVRQGGRDKVLKEKRKNVHAYVVGEIVNTFPSGDVSVLEFPVTYNPYKYDSFVKRADESKVFESDYAVLSLNEDGKPQTSALEVWYNEEI